MDGLPSVTHSAKRFCWDLAAGRGSGRLWRFTGAGSLCDHRGDRVGEPPPSDCSAFHFKKGQRVALLGAYDQKSLKFERGRFFITKIAVGKFAIGKPKLDLVGLAVIFSDKKMRDASNDGDANRAYNSGD